MCDKGAVSPELEAEFGEDLDEEPLSWPLLQNGSVEEWEWFLSQFQSCLLHYEVPEGNIMANLEVCLERSRSHKALNALRAAKRNAKITDFNGACSAITKYYDQKAYLKRMKAMVVENLKRVKGGWYEQHGYSLNGIAFPVLLKLSTGYLPTFLTCAHCARKKGEDFFRSKILLTPSSSMDPNKSFIFELESGDMVFGCDPEGDPIEYFDHRENDKMGAVDFLALFLKDKKNGKGELVKHFWKAKREVIEGDKVYIAATHENCFRATGDLPYSDDSFVVKAGTKYFHESVKDTEHLMLHDVVGISGLSGECMYAPDEVNKNKLECLLMFKGKVDTPLPSKPHYVGIPIPAIQKYLDQLGQKLNSFCFENVPTDFKTEGFVESYLLLLSDGPSSSEEGETSSSFEDSPEPVIDGPDQGDAPADDNASQEDVIGGCPEESDDRAVQGDGGEKGYCGENPSSDVTVCEVDSEKLEPEGD